MQVKDIMTEDLGCVTPGVRLGDVARMMVERNCGAIPVVESLDSMQLVGIVTDRDIVVRAVALGRDPLDVQVHEVMTRDCVVAAPEDAIEECCDAMEANQIRRILVRSEEGRLVGIVAQADIVKMAPTVQAAEVVREISL